MSRARPALHLATLSAVAAGPLLGGCARHDLDALTQARIFGCLDVAADARQPLAADGYVLRGPGCDGLDPADVRAALPAYRAQQPDRARRLRTATRG
jgi:hypothetical protein